MPAPGKLAIAGIGYSKLARDSGQSVGALALRAGRAAILDAGLGPSQIDGVGGIYSPDLPTVWPGYMIEGLGLSRVAWTSSCMPASANIVVEGLNAVAAGVCEYALVYHAKYCWDTTSFAARMDPLRHAPPMTLDGAFTRALAETCASPMGMAAYMRWHMHHFGSRREHFGMIAVNNRTNAQKNPRAVFHGKPITMDDYLASREISSPFTLLDMDPPIDGAMALVITTAARAADLPHKAVLVDGYSNGATGCTDLTFQPFDFYPAAKFLADELWRQADCGPADIDLANIYDGFTILAMDWIEAAFCKQGEGAEFIEDSWDPLAQQIKFFGRIPMSPHGGNLSEGRVQGMGHVLEAVAQLRGTAEARQIPGAKHALVLNGTNPVSAGLILRVA